MPDLTTDVRYVKGIGEQRAKGLEKLGIRTLRDLISYFPRAYDDRRAYKKIKDLVDGENACVEALAAAAPTLNRIRKGLELVKLRAVDETGALDVTFFNQTYRKDNLHAGETYVFFGKAEASGRKRAMANPIVEREGERLQTGRIMPIYPLTAGISQLTLVKAMQQGLAACQQLLPDPLPDQVRRERQLCHIGYAYEQIHFPAGEEELAVARRRLVFEELFLLAIGLKRLRGRRDELACQPWRDTDLGDFYAALPFSLTGAQRRAIDGIRADLASGRPMNRLVQGDVGSGKTMVAAAALLCAVRNGRQAALMAPTEILAEQHYQGLAPLLEKLGVRTVFLTGAMRVRERRAVLAALESGEAQVAIGTHALITADVAYRSLGLVVTDEQHRFGVAQRSALAAKGDRPHLLVMSATPIPRTLALMIYGDLDVSVIDELPPGRQKIDTFSVPGSLLHGGGKRHHPRRPQGRRGVRENAPGAGLSPSGCGLRPRAHEAQGEGQGHVRLRRRRDPHPGVHHRGGGGGGRAQRHGHGGRGRGPLRPQPAPPAPGPGGPGAAQVLLHPYLRQPQRGNPGPAEGHDPDRGRL